MFIINVASFFSGIGGAELAVEMVAQKTNSECKTVMFCEIVKERHYVLNKNFGNHIPIFEDITEIGLKEIKAIVPEEIDLVIQSFPCQPFSQASSSPKKGKSHDHYLLDHVIRIVKELSPNWLLCENVDGFVTMPEGLDEWVNQIEDLGYNCEVACITACGVGAPNERERCAMIAYKDCIKDSMSTTPNLDIAMGNPQVWNGKDIQNPGIKKFLKGVPTEEEKARLEAIGNSINPYQFYPVIRLIKHFDDHYKATRNPNVIYTNQPKKHSINLTGPFLEMLRNFSLYKTPWIHGQVKWIDAGWFTPKKREVLRQVHKHGILDKCYAWSMTPVAWDKASLIRTKLLQAQTKNLSPEEREEIQIFINGREEELKKELAEKYTNEVANKKFEQFVKDGLVISGEDRRYYNIEWQEWIQGFPKDWTELE